VVAGGKQFFKKYQSGWYWKRILVEPGLMASGSSGTLS